MFSDFIRPAITVHCIFWSENVGQKTGHQKPGQKPCQKPCQQTGQTSGQTSGPKHEKYSGRSISEVSFNLLHPVLNWFLNSIIDYLK